MLERSVTGNSNDSRIVADARTMIELARTQGVDGRVTLDYGTLTYSTNRTAVKMKICNMAIMNTRRNTRRQEG